MGSSVKLQARAPLFLAGFAAVIGAVLLAACANGLTFGSDREIRDRIGQIRAAILAKRAEGIVEFGTPDWTFHGSDGKAYDRTGYLERTRALFERVEIESLQTKITSVDIDGARATVQLRQTMVRTETDAAGGRARWKVVYLEGQEWVKTSRGWLVARVQVFTPKREKLSPP